MLLHIICWLLAFAFGIAALIVIERSSGRLVGIRFVIDAFLIVIVSFPLVFLIPAHVKPIPLNSSTFARTASAIQSLCVASKSYRNEYGRWPQPKNLGDLVLIFNGLIDPRTGKDISSTRPDLLEQNPQRVQFMEFKRRDMTPPPRWATTDELSFYDPFGMPYAFCFDNGIGGVYYEGPVENGGPKKPKPWLDSKANDGQIPVRFNDGSTNTVIFCGYAFFSNGPDTRTGTGQSDPGSRYPAKAHEDDVRSW